MRCRAGRRAWAYEKRLEDGKGSELARIRWKELKEKCKAGKVESGWEGEREKFFKDRGVELEEVERKRKEEEWFNEVVQ